MNDTKAKLARASKATVYKIFSYTFCLNFMTNPCGGYYCPHFLANKAKIRKVQ